MTAAERIESLKAGIIAAASLTLATASRQLQPLVLADAV
jgi:hypothetical protein